MMDDLWNIDVLKLILQYKSLPYAPNSLIFYKWNGNGNNGATFTRNRIEPVYTEYQHEALGPKRSKACIL